MYGLLSCWLRHPKVFGSLGLLALPFSKPKGLCVCIVSCLMVPSTFFAACPSVHTKFKELCNQHISSEEASWDVMRLHTLRLPFAAPGIKTQVFKNVGWSCEKMVSPYSRPWNSDSNMHGSHTRQISKQEIAGTCKTLWLAFWAQKCPEHLFTQNLDMSWLIGTTRYNKHSNNPSWKEDV